MLSGFTPLKDALVHLKIRSSLIQKLISSLQTNRRFKTSPLSTSDSHSPVIPTGLSTKRLQSIRNSNRFIPKYRLMETEYEDSALVFKW